MDEDNLPELHGYIHECIPIASVQHFHSTIVLVIKILACHIVTCSGLYIQSFEGLLDEDVNVIVVGFVFMTV